MNGAILKMKLKLILFIAICSLCFLACSQQPSTYEIVTLRAATAETEQAANDTEKEVIKIQNINKSLAEQGRE